MGVCHELLNLFIFFHLGKNLKYSKAKDLDELSFNKLFSVSISVYSYIIMDITDIRLTLKQHGD